MKLEAKQRLTAGAVGSKASDPKDARACWLLERLNPDSVHYEPALGGPSFVKRKQRIEELTKIQDALPKHLQKVWNKIKK